MACRRARLLLGQELQGQFDKATLPDDKSRLKSDAVVREIERIALRLLDARERTSRGAADDAGLRVLVVGLTTDLGVFG